MTDTLYLEGAEPSRPRFPDGNSTGTQHDRDSNRLAGDLSSVCGVVNATAARMVGVISEVLATRAWTGEGIRSAAHWVGWRCGTTPGRAQNLVKMAERLPEMPVTRGLFEAGQLSEDHVKAICRRVPTRFEAEVAELALVLTSTQLSYLVREYPWDDDDDDGDDPQIPKRRVGFGSVSDKLWRLHAQLYPEEGAMLEKALKAARDTLFAECDEQADGDTELAAKLKGRVTWADAMVRLGDSYLGGQDQARATRDRYRILIHLNAQRRFDPGSGHPPTESPPSESTPTQPPAPDSPAGPAPSVPPAGPPPSGPASSGPGRPTTEPPQSGSPPFERAPSKASASDSASSYWLPGLGDEAEPVEPHAHFHLGSALPDSLRRLITCDADLTSVFAYRGVIHHMGAAQRTVGDRLRWTIEQRDKGCRVPGCGRTLWLQIHHIVHWEDGGPTRSWNLCALCAHHHREHHHGGLGIQGDADQTDGLVFTDKHGHPIRPPRPPPPVTQHPYNAASDLNIPVRPYDCAWGEPVQWKWVDLSPRPPSAPDRTNPSMN